MSNGSKFDACSTNRSSFYHPTGLREIPTRISLRNPTDAAVDLLDDGDVVCNQTTTLPPTSLVGDAAPLPYQLQIAAITAVIERMQQHEEATHQDPHLLTSEKLSALAGLSAAIEQQLEHTRPTPQAKPPLLVIAPMNAEPPLLVIAPTNAPMPDSVPAEDDGHYPHDEQRPPSLSLQDTFNLQTHMMRTINMLLDDLIVKVDLIVATICHKNRPILSPLPASPTKPTTICKTVVQPAPRPHSENQASTVDCE